MIHFLRDKRNRSLVDIEAMPKEISCYVPLDVYSNFLLALPEDKQGEFVDDMHGVQEIRGVYWEVHGGKFSSDVLAKNILLPLAKKWKLWYVTD